MRYLALLLLLPVLAVAQPVRCTGTDTSYRCSDSDTGDRITVNVYGNVVQLRGTNTKTGRRWSQRSQTVQGVTTYKGYDNQGNRWNLRQAERAGKTQTTGEVKSKSGIPFYPTYSLTGTPTETD